MLFFEQYKRIIIYLNITFFRYLLSALIWQYQQWRKCFFKAQPKKPFGVDISEEEHKKLKTVCNYTKLLSYWIDILRGKERKLGMSLKMDPSSLLSGYQKLLKPAWIGVMTSFHILQGKTFLCLGKSFRWYIWLACCIQGKSFVLLTLESFWWFEISSATANL